MRSWGALVWVALCACGRQNFNDRGDGGAGSDAGPVNPPTARHTLRLNRVTNTEIETDFPLLVTLDDARVDRTRMLPDASDLTFHDSAGNQLPYEIDERGDPGGLPLKVWVRVPRIDNVSTSISVEYGGSAAAPAGDVWNELYEGVWHFETTGDVTDASPHQRFGAATGTHQTDGVIGHARAFDAPAMDFIRVPDGASLSLVDVTISGWYYFGGPSRSPTGQAVMLGRQKDTTFDDDFSLGISSQVAAAGVTNQIGTSAGVVGQDLSQSWHYLGMTFADQTLRLYVDGNEVSNTTLAASRIHDTLNPIFIGAGCNNGADRNTPDNDFADSSLDEVRIQNIARPPGWIAFEYASMQDEVITYGPLEEL